MHDHQKLTTISWQIHVRLWLAPSSCIVHGSTRNTLTLSRTFASIRVSSPHNPPRLFGSPPTDVAPLNPFSSAQREVLRAAYRASCYTQTFKGQKRGARGPLLSDFSKTTTTGTEQKLTRSTHRILRDHLGACVVHHLHPGMSSL